MLTQVYIHIDKHKLRQNDVIENFVEEKIKSATENFKSRPLVFLNYF